MTEPRQPRYETIHEPERLRWRVAYTVILLSVLMLASTTFLVQRLLSLEDSLRASRAFTEQLVVEERRDCERANLRREQDRYIIGVMAEALSRSTRTGDTGRYFQETVLELRQRLGHANLQPVDCESAYPLPGR